MTILVFVSLIFPLVPGKPRSLVAEVINSSAVSLSWSPPLFKNGIICEYQVNYSGYKPTEREGSSESVSVLLTT